MTEQQTRSPMSTADLSAEQLNEISKGTFADLMGLHVTELGPDRVRGEWTVTPQLHQPAGIQNGGVLCTVVETLASSGGAAWYGERGVVVGVNNNTDFLRAVREGQLSAEATPLHRGGMQQLWQVVVTDADGRLIARGQVRLQNLPHRS
ncbi:PaaI family thioesterase [Nocardia jinanensis]|uniref:Esterase n=1 Tax=Nocardia jinanensis TaxID=382504 RepID=A0A917RBJ7_9NOCA|nr:PaaI family thioesterase [Nocardia jinanensis]GGL00338.1 esterase [Nocardia jinanensis]